MQFALPVPLTVQTLSSSVAIQGILVGCSACLFVLYFTERPHCFIRRRQIHWDSVRSGSLVEIEIYIRAAPVVNQGGHRVYYELCSICVVDDSVF